MTTPVLMLTARGEIGDKIKGLDLGADDYLAKPFSLDELLARVRALFRRSGGQADSVLQVKDLRLDTVSREVTKGGKSVELTAREFSILEFLFYNKNRAVSRFSLAEHVWGDAFDPFSMSNFMDVHIKNLRRKIGDTVTAPSSGPFVVSGILSRMKPNDHSTKNFSIDHRGRIYGQLGIFLLHIMGDDGATITVN